MNPLRRPSWPAAIRLAALGLLAGTSGCNVIPPPQADMTRFYVLAEPGAGPARTESAGGLKVGLKAVELPSYLRNSEMVVRHGTNEIAFQDYSRWAEPLDAAILRILRSELSAAPDVGRVFTEPFPLEGNRDCDVKVRIIRCEGARGPGGRAVATFAAIVDVTTPAPESRILSHHVFSAPDAAWDGENYGRLASQLGKSVDALARDVIASLPQEPAAK